MSVQALIDDLSTDGIRLTLCKGQIEVRGAKEVVSANVVRRIRSNKPGLVALLSDELVKRAGNAVDGISTDDLRGNLDSADWLDGDLIGYEPLKALARAIRSSRRVLGGQTPIGWTATTQCRNCGPVPTFPGGTNTVLACPWCMNGQTSPPLPGHEQ